MDNFKNILRNLIAILRYYYKLNIVDI